MNIIKCPSCQTEIPLDAALSAQVEKDLDAKYNKRLADEKKSLEKKLREEISSKQSDEIQELEDALKYERQLAETAKANESELRKQKRDLEQKAKDLDLELDRKLDQEREKILSEADAAHRLKDAEKDGKLNKALEQLKDMERRLAQGSQQSQGEVLELELESQLAKNFPLDIVEPVAKGVRGGDILLTVVSKNSRECGKILYELKRTKSFSESWLQKLKADARSCKADLMLLVTETLPEGVKSFAEIDGVWVSSVPAALALSGVLREILIHVSREKNIQSNKKEKAELVYEYMVSNEFKSRFGGIVDAFKTMKEDLDSERRAIDKIFAKREKQIGQVLLNLSGMHGDIEAIAGKSELPQIESLQL